MSDPAELFLSIISHIKIPHKEDCYCYSRSTATENGTQRFSVWELTKNQDRDQKFQPHLVLGLLKAHYVTLFKAATDFLLPRYRAADSMTNFHLFDPETCRFSLNNL